jgi:hypothetical protein
MPVLPAWVKSYAGYEERALAGLSLGNISVEEKWALMKKR